MENCISNFNNINSNHNFHKHKIEKKEKPIKLLTIVIEHERINKKQIRKQI